MLTDQEIESLKELVEIYPNAALQNLPDDKKELASNVLKKIEFVRRKQICCIKL